MDWTLPIKPEDVEITIQGDVLRIQGETRREGEVTEGQFHRQERHFGRFHREVALPASVKADHVDARFEHGVLTLHMPKAEEAKARRIQIQGVTPPQIEQRAA